MISKKKLSVLLILILLSVTVWAGKSTESIEAARFHQHQELKQADALPKVILHLSTPMSFEYGAPLETFDVKIEIQKDPTQSVHEKTWMSNGKIRYRGNSSLYYDKKQYQIHLINEAGEEEKRSVLGMSADEEWVLNGSMIDQSFIRNYLGFNIAGEIMDYAPNVRFCEVELHIDGEVIPQGLYLFVENVKRGEDRVDIKKYDPALPSSAYVIRRDRYHPDENIISTYADEIGASREFIGVKYPGPSTINKETLDFIQEDVSKIEQVLYASDQKIFETYPDYIDVDSFVDYFIINEFLANYDAGIYSTYAYKDLGGKLSMGPVWDFDQELGNDPVHEFRVDQFVLPSYPWFNALVKDREFIDRVVERYHELRQGVLSETYLLSYIDDTIVFLGDSIERDRDIWIADETLEKMKDYGTEIEKMKSLIHEKGDWMDLHIDDLYQYTRPPVVSNAPRNLAAILFVLSFILAVLLARRE
ncbi:CotH kinase family protein [Gottschalkiaceae bacterium SANA]|nr:CotH kinase family protein [Gottschalkiaceae bacterium SANA]